MALIIYFLSPFVFIFLLSIPLNVAILPYLKGGLEMVSGYNEIMYLKEHFILEYLVCLYIIVVTTGVLLVSTWHEKKLSIKNLVTLFMFSASMFILYKQAFTRNDSQHVSEFYKCVLLFIVCIGDFHYKLASKSVKLVMVIVVVPILFIINKNNDFLAMNKYKLTKQQYVKRFKNYSDSAGLYMFSATNSLPKKIKDKIGTASVDTYPWNSLLLIQNKLKYTPRPAFQSYTAYTPYLENLNFEFYNSQNAPSYLLYEFEAIDERYALFDEPKLHLSLLRNYVCVDTFSYGNKPVLLLKKKTVPGKTVLQKVREYEISITDKLFPKENIYYELLVNNTLTGKLVSLIRYSPELNLVIEKTDGSQRQYRTSKKLLESGIFLTQHFNNTADFYNYLSKDSLDKSNEISCYRIVPANPGLFKDKLTIIEYRIKD